MIAAVRGEAIDRHPRAPRLDFGTNSNKPLSHTYQPKMAVRFNFGIPPQRIGLSIPKQSRRA